MFTKKSNRTAPKMLRSVPSIYFILTSLWKKKKKSFSATAKSRRSLLFSSRAMVHNFLFSLHKRWQARIYSERNSPCLLCYIKPEMKKIQRNWGRERCLNTTQEWCTPATLKLLLFSIFFLSFFFFFSLLSIFG